MTDSLRRIRRVFHGNCLYYHPMHRKWVPRCDLSMIEVLDPERITK